MIIQGGEIVCFGMVVNYEYKEVPENSGCLSVSLRTKNMHGEDTFQRANITNILIDPEGNLHAYNVKFSSRFVRPNFEKAE